MCILDQKDESFYAGGINGIIRVIDAGNEKIHKQLKVLSGLLIYMGFGGLAIFLPHRYVVNGLISVVTEDRVLVPLSAGSTIPSSIATGSSTASVVVAPQSQPTVAIASPLQPFATDALPTVQPPSRPTTTILTYEED
ncbi:hypothetical protein Ccrd_010347 [Cynara cardunculus var. scolymus]|uniref:Uncharacterized protein n=1 Tax=Cynara cardunculus var. scolymus TaxID=59895 RepID=A0A103YLB1_CYNCS|nr:hypothetical protein Ccrd_010347 [Cynara cardunculus var. scolymus]